MEVISKVVQTIHDVIDILRADNLVVTLHGLDERAPRAFVVTAHFIVPQGLHPVVGIIDFLEGCAQPFIVFFQTGRQILGGYVYVIHRHGFSFLISSVSNAA
jgi:hypothetical protein